MQKNIVFTVILLLICISISTAQTNVTLSGIIKDKNTKSILPYVNIVLKTEKENTFVSGTISDEEGRFLLTKIKSGNYTLEISFIGYTTKKQTLFIGNLSDFLDLKTIEIEEKSDNDIIYRIILIQEISFITKN